ncbi:MAG: hypothetical protein Q8O03_06695 [Nanoarchaeota archaeon]|nr:hypothetical protein [Nanoarchaeota archaeon]
MENTITESKTIPQQALSKKPKRILYLVSADFETDYEVINNNFKSKLELYYQMKKETKQLPKKSIENLESTVKNFNLEKESFNTHLGDLNLIEKKTNQPFIIRENTKEQEVYLVRFNNKKEFFNALLNEKEKSLDEIIIFCHGYKAFINTDVSESLIQKPSLGKFLKLFNPNSYVTSLTIRFMPEEKIKGIRSKLSDDAVVYLLSCEALKNSDKQTTIGEAFAYLFGKPVIASKEVNDGWPVDANPYDKMDFSKPETVKEKNVSYKVNYLEGDWYMVGLKN